MAGPLVRSSYRAGRLYAQTVAHRGEELSPALAHLAQPRVPRGRRRARCSPGRETEPRDRRHIVGTRPYPGAMPAKPKLDKAAKKEARPQKRAASKARRRQIWEAFKIQRREDKKLVPLMVGAFLLAVLVVVGIGLIFGVQWLVLPIGIALGVLAAVSIFGRRVQRSVYSKAEGQPGAAGWALENMRGSWRVTPGVAGTTHLDAVHRVIGRPGVILVAEGAPHRVKGLLAQEKKRHARVVGKTPIYDIVVGNDEGQVPLGKLQRHVMKLPRNISTGEMDSLETRLAALGSRAAALPKGPLPAGREDAERPAHGPPPLTCRSRRRRLSRGCGRRSWTLPGRASPARRVTGQRGQDQGEQCRPQDRPGHTDQRRPQRTPPGCPARPCPA